MTIATSPPAAAGGVSADPMVPRLFRVTARRRETVDTVTLGLVPSDGEPLRFAAGQFTMIGSLRGGEAPISVSGDPDESWLLEQTIRDVGGVTHALCTARPGGQVTVRGPFGHGWPVDRGAGGDLLLVAGGIGLAPLRPVILQVIKNRARFRQVFIRVGCRAPAELLFGRQVAVWRGRLDLDLEVTVDSAPPGWRGRVGLVTSVLPTRTLEPDRILALVCGPEVMMRHTAAALVDRGIPPARIMLSMERSMTCGIGLCGHCQFRELFICRDGPVLPYDRVARLLGQREL